MQIEIESLRKALEESKPKRIKLEKEAEALRISKIIKHNKRVLGTIGEIKFRAIDEETKPIIILLNDYKEKCRRASKRIVKVVEDINVNKGNVIVVNKYSRFTHIFPEKYKSFIKMCKLRFPY